MTNTREKLIELLSKTRYEYRRYIAMKDYEKRIAKTDEEFLAVDDSIVGEIPFCADYLIANGVTVQEWIPVTERLPEEHESTWAKLYGTKSWVPGMFRKWSNTVIACVERVDGRKRVIALHTIDGKWDWHKMQDIEQVTHWMPLPEPPKEEG